MAIISWKFFPRVFKRREDSLPGFSKTYAFWDPTLVNYQDTWYLYLLACRRKNGQGKFITRDTFFNRVNYIHGFRSKTLGVWENLGPVFNPWHNQQRLCAGSTLVVDKTIYFFGSYAHDIIPRQIRDEWLYLANSNNGYTFSREPTFRLEPDPAWYGTKRTYPTTNAMVFAWRDPFIFQDPNSGSYYLFVCAGGEPWGVPPTVAVAVAENITGPYELLPPAVDITVELDGKSRQALGEIEKIQVVYRNNKYYILFSCWLNYLNRDFVRHCRSIGHLITNSTLYILSSDQVTGPYRLDLDYPTVKNSDQTGLYGICLVTPESGKDSESILTGWVPTHFTAFVENKYTVAWEAGNIHVREPHATLDP